MNTLVKILSSRARAAFFEILFGIDLKELHLREIQRRSGLAIETVRKEANNLDTLNLVVKRQDGNRSYYKANANHPLFEEIHQMVIKTSGMKEILQESLKDNAIKFAFVFGSIAKGNITAESDIDLFIIGDIGLRKISNLIKGPVEKLGREINPHTMSDKEFIKRIKERDHFVSEVFRSKKVMIIGEKDEFARLVE